MFRPRYAIALTALTAVGAGLMFFGTGGAFAPPDAGGEWTAWSVLFRHGSPVFLFTPLIIGFICGAGFAEDSSTGYQWFIRIRMGSRIKSVSCKAVAILISSFIGFFASFLLLAAIAFLLTDHSSPLPKNVVYFNEGLFLLHPYLYLVLLAGIAGLGASAMAGVACFASLWIKNPYAAGAAPIGYLFGSIAFESLLKVYYFNIFSALSLADARFNLQILTSIWLVHIIVLYGITVFLYENDKILPVLVLRGD
ncbi:MAG: hypothetical protein DDT42_00774 [candidate division WS2 bacterium]|uniref:ABC-2 family transporter protein n=1 Tax=Psychracetigena formicireducens TaxID=2986056 RepID=A0A9E2BG06_PSYF1|nr:hypothetical protein [Candidatus Psychracetigena formicireducens]